MPLPATTPAWANAACASWRTSARTPAGGLTKWFEPADPVFIRFYTRFDPACDYVHHFVTLRANKGLRGGDKWTGFGGAGLKPDGTYRFSTAIEPWGDRGRWPAPGRLKGSVQQNVMFPPDAVRLSERADHW